LVLIFSATNVNGVYGRRGFSSATDVTKHRQMETTKTMQSIKKMPKT
jgi:hypothetical protein